MRTVKLTLTGAGSPELGGSGDSSLRHARKLLPEPDERSRPTVVRSRDERSVPADDASIDFVGHATVLVDLGGRPAAHRSAPAEPRHAPTPGGEGRSGRAARRRRGADLAPPLRPPRPALAAAARPRDARRRAEGRRRADPAQGGGRRTSSSSGGRAGRDRRAHRPRHPGEHDTGRLPFGVKAEPLGYVIEGGGRSRVLRRRHRHLRRDGGPRARRRRAAPDLGLGADDGAGPHGSGRRRARRRRSSQARVAIPIHWGTYYPIHLGLRGPPGVPRHAPGAVRAGDAGALAYDGGAGAPAGGADRDLRLASPTLRRNAWTPAWTERWSRVRADALVDARARSSASSSIAGTPRELEA